MAAEWRRSAVCASWLWSESSRALDISCGPFIFAPEGVERSSSILYFRVADIHESYGSLRDAGVEFVGEPHVIHRTDDYELFMAFFHDSEGNVRALMHESGTI